MLQRLTLIVAFVLAPSAAGQDENGAWPAFIERASAEHGDLGRRAATFLADHRPPRDETITLELLMENLEYALKAREDFPWARALTEEQFFNDVLPYAVLDETREPWRADFYERCRAIVAECTTATEAAQAINQKLFHEIGVHYNTGRKKPNQSPAESMTQGRATCTGLSIILVDGCRAVGVPARVAGVATWHDKRGNHTWVEVWDGDWHYTGADEYNAGGLNRAWFTGDARKAVPGDPVFAVWATSWAETGHTFPMVWNEGDESVPGVDVSQRYVGDPVGSPSRAQRFLRTWETVGGDRFEAKIEVIDGEGALLKTVTTRAGTADLNDMPSVSLAPGERHELRIHHAGEMRTMILEDPAPGNATLEIHWDALALAKERAEALVAEVWTARAEAIRQERRAELETEAIVLDGHTLKILEKSFGDEPMDGHSLWISMHGGGGAPEEVNDRQWRNQIKLYEPEEGIYLAPRAPTNTWNLWHQGHVDALFDRLIETYVSARGVNPNRVYLMGYSAGGDGVFQLAPRMADRFASAAMMAGHPNETQPLGLRNLPFMIFMGGDDAAYNRNAVAQQWGEKLASLREADADGYLHQVTIYEGLGHWMQGKDAEALPWMAAHARDPWPKRVVWHQDDVTHTRYYWLSVSPEHAKARTTITAEVNGQTITLESPDVPEVTMRLRDALVDLDRPVIVIANGQTVFEGMVSRTGRAITRSFGERGDPASAATAELTVRW